MEKRYLPAPEHLELMTTEEIRETFLVDTLFNRDKVDLLYSDTERAVVGSAVPAVTTLNLDVADELRSNFFLERRELGIINIGGAGTVVIDSETFKMSKLDALYAGRGSKSISFESKDSKNPAKFYLLSYPAHTAYPTKLIRKSDAKEVKLGSMEDSNKRTIYQYILPGKVESCQLVMGLTILEPGSVWNTMGAHTHARRTEIYMYFDLDGNSRVFHIMGEPDNTRHIVMKNEEAVLSPSWSIHSGAGTKNYTFIWGMGGENQDFDDMDFVAMETLR